METDQKAEMSDRIITAWKSEHGDWKLARADLTSMDKGAAEILV